jgi:hypothetical protein
VWDVVTAARNPIDALTGQMKFDFKCPVVWAEVPDDAKSLLRGKTLHRLLYEFVHVLFEVVGEFVGVPNLLRSHRLPQLALCCGIRHGNLHFRQTIDPYIG